MRSLSIRRLAKLHTLQRLQCMHQQWKLRYTQALSVSAPKQLLSLPGRHVSQSVPVSISQMWSCFAQALLPHPHIVQVSVSPLSKVFLRHAAAEPPSWLRNRKHANADRPTWTQSAGSLQWLRTTQLVQLPHPWSKMLVVHKLQHSITLSNLDIIN